MTSLLRQIVAGPRAKHLETGLDLCYVTDNIIATSGPSQTYPQRAYRNPLDRLVAFLDAKHGEDWAIWEFRAEGTGYPDEAVYGRIRHYPWPDHHPPPFALVPMIMASMRNWLNGEQPDPSASGKPPGTKDTPGAKEEGKGLGSAVKNAVKDVKKEHDNAKRVVVVHCKAGKGRSGSMACSYLIAECGWAPKDALARFTERRMRPNFGAGVSIPSQLRWISYVDRWTRHGKKFVDREIEILEVHVWGLRHGVKVSVECFADEGKKIKLLHTFMKNERHIVAGDAPGGGGVMDFIGDAWSPIQDEDGEICEDADFDAVAGGASRESRDNAKKGAAEGSDADSNKSGSSTPSITKSKPLKGSRTSLLGGRKPSRNSSVKKINTKSKTINPADFSATNTNSPTGTTPESSNTSLPNPSQKLSHSKTFADTNEPGGMAVIFKPSQPVRIPNSDVSVSLERRNRAPASMGLTMVTAVAHVWFNTFFEGNGPEQNGKADDSGVFEIEWDKMDGIKGSSRKGTRAADKISVVWRAAGTSDVSHVATTGPEQQDATPGVVITEPGEGSPVPQMRPADWKGAVVDDPNGKTLGLRTEDPGSQGVSKASSIKSQVVSDDEVVSNDEDDKEADTKSLEGVKSSGPQGEEIVDLEDADNSSHSTSLPILSKDPVETDDSGKGQGLSNHDKKFEATKGRTEHPDLASGSMISHHRK